MGSPPRHISICTSVNFRLSPVLLRCCAAVAQDNSLSLGGYALRQATNIAAVQKLLCTNSQCWFHDLPRFWPRMQALAPACRVQCCTPRG